MRAEAVRGSLCAGWVLICVAATAAQIGPAISDEQRRVLEQKLPDVTIGEIRSTPVPGWNEIWLNGEPMYVSADARYLLNGRLDQGTALTLWRVPTTSGDLPLGTPARTPQSATVPVPAVSLPPDAEQPGSTVLVSTGSASLHAVIQQGRSLWTTHPIACTWRDDNIVRACARWYEIDLDSSSLR